MVGNKAVQPAGVAAYHAVRLGEGERGFKAAVAEPKPAAAVFHVKRFVGGVFVCADELRRVFYGHVLALNAVFNRGNHVVPLFQPCVYHIVIALLRRAGGEHIERHCARYYGGGSGAGIEYHCVAAVFALYEAHLRIEAFKPAAVEHYVAPVVYARVPAKSVAAAAQGIHVLLGGWYNGRGHRRVLRRAAKPLPAFAYAAARHCHYPFGKILHVHLYAAAGAGKRRIGIAAAVRRVSVGNIGQRAFKVIHVAGKSAEAYCLHAKLIGYVALYLAFPAFATAQHLHKIAQHNVHMVIVLIRFPEAHARVKIGAFEHKVAAATAHLVAHKIMARQAASVACHIAYAKMRARIMIQHVKILHGVLNGFVPADKPFVHGLRRQHHRPCLGAGGDVK